MILVHIKVTLTLNPVSLLMDFTIIASVFSISFISSENNSLVASTLTSTSSKVSGLVTFIK